MSDAYSLPESNSGVDSSVTRTRNSALETTPFHDEGFGQHGMPQPDSGETNQGSEDKANSEQQLQHEVVRSSEEVIDTMLVLTPRSSSSSSASSTSSSASSPSTTPSLISPSSSKSLGVSVSSDHPSVVALEAEDHTSAVGRPNDVTTSRMASPDLPEDVEASTAETSPSSSTSSLPKAPFRVSTSASAINVQGTGLDHGPYGLLSLLRPRTTSSLNLNVRFAPLPELAPRKRKSSMPLGMAARSQLTRKKRIYQVAHEDQDPCQQNLCACADGHPEGGNHEADSVEMRMLKKRVLEKLRKQREEEEAGAIEEDSLVVLAKKMGSAGKNLWKKMVAQKAGGEDTSAPNEPSAASSGVIVIAEKPVSGTVDPVTLPTLLEDTEKVDRLPEKSPVWMRSKLQSRKPQAPTLFTT
jgi:hypothetical protein